jgi:non-homologous end joining protein Ku
MVDLRETGEEELVLFTQIVDKLTVVLDLSVFHDSYKERIGALFDSKGEIAQVDTRCSDLRIFIDYNCTLILPNG